MAIAEKADRFRHITKLFIGDMDYETCEVSWIIQGDYSRLWKAMPQPQIGKLRKIGGGQHFPNGIRISVKSVILNTNIQKKLFQMRQLCDVSEQEEAEAWNGELWYNAMLTE